MRHARAYRYPASPACAGCGRTGSLLCDRCVRAFRPPFRDDDRFVAADAGIALGDAPGFTASSLEGLPADRRPEVHRRVADRGSAGQRQPPALRRLLAITGPAILVPVLIHTERRRVRGYNQAELIAAELASSVELPMAALLERARETTKQHRLDRAARLANLGGSNDDEARTRHCGDRRRRHRHDDGHARGVRRRSAPPALSRSTSPSPGRSRPECRPIAARRRPACPTPRRPPGAPGSRGRLGPTAPAAMA